ncbi:MAG: lipid-A-disaccharide synthase [Muribaculum sp.]|nr:lipid-A-disaccharide synthase [Muribaculaceae bacterium]MCM1081426.1 lipid-A-disaccharide synthase [Muribaculum sp.]
MKYFICAGEASGDLHASHLIKALKEYDPNAEFAFLGGDMMQKSAGCKPLIHYREMAYMGFSEVLRHLPQVLGNLRQARNMLSEFRPNALILVDYPSFNLKLAAYAHNKGIPVYYFISPKVWAWKEHRVKQIKRYVNRVFSILPFEIEFYQNRHNYQAIYVGNPSVREVSSQIANLPLRNEFARYCNLNPENQWVALVPGSRKGEIRNNLPVMLKAFCEATKNRYGIEPVVTAAPGIDDEFYKAYLPNEVKLLRDQTLGLMHYSQAALVTSGTATLECALAGTPQVVCYRANGQKISYKIMERLLKVNYVSLPNLIANQPIIPEMLVHRCTPKLVSAQLEPLLSDTNQRHAQLNGYKTMKSILGSNDCFATTAEIITADLTGNRK